MKRLQFIVLFITIIFSYSISAQTVYTTKTGEKYHKSNCRYLKRSKKAIKLDKAKALGYMPCKVCKPTKENTKEKSKNNSNSLTSKKKNPPASAKKTYVDLVMTVI